MKIKKIKILKLFFKTGKDLRSLYVILLSKGGAAMKDKLCVTDRRLKLLDYLAVNKFATRTELAEQFNVSTDTIDRDIVYLSSHAPIYTKQGNGGGIIISPKYRNYINYLTDTEEELLYKLKQYIENEENPLWNNYQVYKKSC